MSHSRDCLDAYPGDCVCGFVPFLTGEQLAVMTLDQIDAAGREGRIDPSRTVACQVGHHAPKCKGRGVREDFSVSVCGCVCHVPPESPRVRGIENDAGEEGR